MNAVEAMAAGKSVIAVGEGGYLETVEQGLTGTFVSPDPASVARAVSGFGKEWTGSREACEQRSLAFDRSVFEQKMKDAMEGAHDGNA
jgi:glycosyltransferase involved in cell wall biosynthesis